MKRDNNPDRLDDGARAEAEMKEREAHAFTGNGPGVIGADNCQICGKWYDEHPAPQGDDTLVGRLERRADTMNGCRAPASDGGTYIVGYYSLGDQSLDREAATALRAKEAEIVRLKAERDFNARDGYKCGQKLADMEMRAESAESRLASAMEALTKAEYSLTKDSLCEGEKIDDALSVVRATLSRLKQGEKGGPQSSAPDRGEE